MKIKILYATVPFGALGGFPALWLRADTERETSLDEAKKAIRDNFTAMNIRKEARILCFDARPAAAQGQDIGAYTSLLDWALEQNIFVVHYLNGKQRPPYVRMGGITKTYLKEKEWLEHETFELFWLPQSKDDEPPNSEAAKTRYLVKTKRINLRWVMDFTIGCEKSWAVFIPPADSVEVILHG